MSKRVNFSRHIEIQWLDSVAVWIAEGKQKKELDEQIDLMLKPSVKCKVNRGKTRNQLIELWSPKSDDVTASFAQFAIESVLGSEYPDFVLHWGMLVAKNNFFADVVRFIGRREKHAEVFTYAQVQKNIVELYGDTETVKRSLRSVLKTLVNFRVLGRQTNRTYKAHKLEHKVETKYKSWFLQSLMYNQRYRSRSLADMLDDLVWFPFVFTVSVNELETTWFDLHQQGNDLVLFKK
ncbi:MULTISPECIES: hypothetical protein [Providencia]|uniref:hypothetical protein n=1 Tax=Providencia TaxID=586 RepID=UPI0018E78993|nr:MULTISPECIES: hypothetical protein [Providencia]ELR5252510.1 hypothetical protein [Providencia rettgeri]MBQ0209699.1 hypothetical protein [Providencia rettgeri]MBQ0314202.1 hypothetical protein [Providencia rettgeri]MBQ0322965.1 hypothetical protein [Providencia rettgeri]MBQ0328659.1 hypothetical protein [Providencia rettgeri]